MQQPQFDLLSQRGDVLVVDSGPAHNAARQRRPAVIVVETNQKQSHGPRVHRDISSLSKGCRCVSSSR